jgi:hypothetical protein
VDHRSQISRKLQTESRVADHISAIFDAFRGKV